MDSALVDAPATVNHMAERNDLIQMGDSIELIKNLPDESVHLILSDIPYGIGLDDWDVLHKNTNSAYGGNSPAQGKAGAVFKKRGKPINGWSEADRRIPKEYEEWCATWASEWLRVLKPGGSALIFAGRRFSHRCIVALEDAGFNFKDSLVWLKPRSVHRAQRLSVVYERRGDTANAEKWVGWRLGNLQPTYEPIIWAFKPYKLTISDNALEHELGAFNQEAIERALGSKSNVLECGFEKNELGLHPAQKPVKLMEALIELVTRPGHVVLDPFSGSGSTALAAKNLGRSSISFERNEQLIEIIQQRLSAQAQLGLV